MDIIAAVNKILKIVLCNDAALLCLSIWGHARAFATTI